MKYVAKITFPNPNADYEVTVRADSLTQAIWRAADRSRSNRGRDNGTVGAIKGADGVWVEWWK